jgi:hypothetical protein
MDAAAMQAASTTFAQTPVAQADPYAAALAAQQRAAAEQAAKLRRIADAERKNLTTAAEIKRDTAEAEAAEAERLAVDAEEALPKRKAALAAAESGAADAVRRYREVLAENIKQKEKWIDESARNQVLIGIGSVFASIGGHDERGMNAFRAGLEIERMRMARRYDLLSDKQAMALTGVKDAEEARDRLAQEVDMKIAAKARAAAERYKAARLRQFGGRIADLERDDGAAKLDLEAYKLERQLVRGSAIRAARAAAGGGKSGGGTGAGGTEGMRERQAAFMGAKEALTTLIRTGGVSDKGAETIYNDQLAAQTIGPGGELMLRKVGLSKTLSEKLSNNDMDAYNAHLRLAQYGLKLFSGAAVTETERKAWMQAYGPQPGDSAAVRKEKLHALGGVFSNYAEQGNEPDGAREFRALWPVMMERMSGKKPSASPAPAPQAGPMLSSSPARSQPPSGDTITLPSGRVVRRVQ